MLPAFKVASYSAATVGCWLRVGGCGGWERRVYFCYNTIHRYSCKFGSTVYWFYDVRRLGWSNALKRGTSEGVILPYASCPQSLACVCTVNRCEFWPFDLSISTAKPRSCWLLALCTSLSIVASLPLGFYGFVLRFSVCYHPWLALPWLYSSLIGLNILLFIFNLCLRDPLTYGALTRLSLRFSALFMS
jgi:hypothetical protein